MPTYDYGCENHHDFEHRCNVSARPETIPCPVEGCGKLAKQIILGTPYVWKDTYVFDYPGSKRLKAGFVHSHGDPGVKKVSVGAGGALNPSTKSLHPLADRVQPDRVKREKTQ